MGIKRRCQSCGKPYTAERDTSRYCGPACRQREMRKRRAGDPEAIPARRPGTTTPGASRTVTLMLTPGTSVELPPDLAAKIAPHLPVPGVDGPVAPDVGRDTSMPATRDDWEVDERPLRARQRTGDAPWEPHPWETRPEPQSAPEGVEGNPVEAALREAAAGGATIIDAASLAQLTAEQLRGGQPPEPLDPKARERERQRREEDERQARVEHYSQTEEDIWEMLGSTNSIASATRTDLGEEGIKTPWGRNALMLAMRLDYARLEKASAVASLSREWRAALREARDLGAGEVEDEVTAAARRRRERIEAAQREAAAASAATQNGGA